MWSKESIEKAASIFAADTDVDFVVSKYEGTTAERLVMYDDYSLRKVFLAGCQYIIDNTQKDK